MRLIVEQFSLCLCNPHLRESLRQLSIRDTLTALYDRYFLEELVLRELSRA